MEPRIISYRMAGDNPIEVLMPVEQFFAGMRRLIPTYSKLFRPSLPHWGDFWREGWSPSAAVVDLIQMWQ